MIRARGLRVQQFSALPPGAGDRALHSKADEMCVVDRSLHTEPLCFEPATGAVRQDECALSWCLRSSGGEFCVAPKPGEAPSDVCSRPLGVEGELFLGGRALYSVSSQETSVKVLQHGSPGGGTTPASARGNAGAAASGEEPRQAPASARSGGPTLSILGNIKVRDLRAGTEFTCSSLVWAGKEDKSLSLSGPVRLSMPGVLSLSFPAVTLRHSKAQQQTPLRPLEQHRGKQALGLEGSEQGAGLPPVLEAEGPVAGWALLRGPSLAGPIKGLSRLMGTPAPTTPTAPTSPTGHHARTPRSSRGLGQRPRAQQPMPAAAAVSAARGVAKGAAAALFGRGAPDAADAALARASLGPGVVSWEEAAPAGRAGQGGAAAQAPEAEDGFLVSIQSERGLSCSLASGLVSLLGPLELSCPQLAAKVVAGAGLFQLGSGEAALQGGVMVDLRGTHLSTSRLAWRPASAPPLVGPPGLHSVGEEGSARAGGSPRPGQYQSLASVYEWKGGWGRGRRGRDKDRPEGASVEEQGSREAVRQQSLSLSSARDPHRKEDQVLIWRERRTRQASAWRPLPRLGSDSGSQRRETRVWASEADLAAPGAAQRAEQDRGTASGSGLLGLGAAAARHMLPGLWGLGFLGKGKQALGLGLGSSQWPQKGLASTAHWGRDSAGALGCSSGPDAAGPLGLRRAARPAKTAAPKQLWVLVAEGKTRIWSQGRQRQF